jgi:hypothetical protein
MVPPPVVLGFILCEKIIVEEKTKNLTLVSTFNKLVVEDFPSTRPLALYAVFTGGLGRATIDVEISSLGSDEVIHELQRSVHFPNRLTDVQALFRINDCTFTEPGKYQIVLRVDGEAVALRNLRVMRMEDKT